MYIDRKKHNKYVTNTLLKTTEQTTTDTSTSTGTGSTTIIYTGGGGSGTGLTPEQSEKLDSIESGAQVNQNAFSYLTISNGEKESTQAARIQTDTAKLTILGEGVTVELVTEVESPERTITSIGIEGEYKVSYHKVETEVEVPSEEGEPTTEVQITWPLTITYVSGTKIKQEDFDTLKVVYNGVDTALTDYQVTTDTEGITSITKNQEGLLFDKIVFTKAGVDAEGQPITNEVMTINAYTISYSTIKLTGSDAYWKLDENGNLYTTYNAYSTQELSAYGLGETGGGGTGGESYLKYLKDVDVTNLINGGILQYNSTTQMWEVVDGSSLEIDMTEIEQKITTLEGKVTTIETTITNWTPIIEAVDNITDWFSFVDGKIRANYDLWGVGEISAYGIGEGGGSTGVSWLRDLEDVTLDPVVGTGDLLSFNGSVWVNIDKSEVGLNETELHNYLTQNQYITQSALNNYVTDSEFTALQATVNNHTTQINSIQSAIDLLNDMFEWDNGKIKAKADLYGVGEISAYGIGEGSSSQGAGYLHELDDVSIVPSELTAGQLLQYNGSVWVAIDKDEVGLNETELHTYLTQNNYTTTADLTWNNIQNKPETFHTTLSFINDLNENWDSLLNTNPTDYVTRWPTFAEVTDKPTTAEGYGITDVYTMTASDDRYVNVTGDTMTGNLILPTLQANTSVIIGSVRLEYDSTNNALKVVSTSGGMVNLYATGEVSAYGYDTEVPVMVSELDDLTDVTISNPTNGQVLVYNGSLWVNQTIETGGLDEDELESYLQSNNYVQTSDLSSYATQTWVTNNFLQSSDLNGYATQSWVNTQLSDYVQDISVNDSVYSPNSSGRVTLPDFVTRYSVDSDGTQVISTNLRLKDSSNYGQYLYFGDGSYVYLAELTDDDLTIHATNLNLDVTRLLVNGEELALDINISNSGSGNVVTNITANSNTLTVTKGFTLNSGSSGRLAYYSGSSTIDDYTSTIGSSTRLWYLSSGTPTNSSSTVGSSSQPVYLSSGTITATTASFLTTSNYTSTTDGRYVKKTGDSMTGTLTNTADFTSGGGFYLTSSHGRFFWDSDTSTTWLQANTSGTLRLSGLNNTRLTRLGINAVRVDINGAVYIENSGADNQMRLTRSDTSSSGTSIIYANSGGILGYIGVTGSGQSPAKEPYYRYGTSSTIYKIYHSGNITDLEQRGYMMSPQITIDARNLNENTWYPVTVAGRSYTSCLYQVFNDLGMSSSTKPSWATHNNGFTAHLEWYTNQNGWGVCPITYLFIRNQHDWCTVMPVRGVSQMAYSSTIYFYVRGGGLYYFRASHGTPTVTLRTSTYTVNGQSVSPTTTAPALNNLGWSYTNNSSGSTSSWQVRINPVNGSLFSTGEITAYQSSDRRLKDNIHDLNSIDIIRKLRPVEFDWTDEALEMKFDKTRHSYGLIAQEVEEVLPDIVHYNMFGKDYLSLDYNKLIPITLSAVREIDDEVSMLKRRVAELEDRLSKYESIN